MIYHCLIPVNFHGTQKQIRDVDAADSRQLEQTDRVIEITDPVQAREVEHIAHKLERQLVLQASHEQNQDHVAAFDVGSSELD